MTEETKKETVTEVTSLAKEEQLTGKQVKVPSAEELVARASGSLLSNLRQLEVLLPKLSSRGMKRAVVAGLNLPQDGVPVRLQNDQEKIVFAIIQRVIGDRFIITQHHINKQIQEQRALEAAMKQAEENKETKEKTDE